MDSFDFDLYAYRDNDSDSDYSDYDYGDDGPDIIPPRDSSPTPPIHRAIGVTFTPITPQPPTESTTQNQKHKEECKKIKEEHYAKHPWIPRLTR
jgi:hypothetical protein